MRAAPPASVSYAAAGALACAALGFYTYATWRRRLGSGGSAEARAFRRDGFVVAAGARLGAEAAEAALGLVASAANAVLVRRAWLERPLDAVLAISAGVPVPFLVRERQPLRFDMLLPELADERWDAVTVAAPWVPLVEELLGGPATLVAAGCLWAEPHASGGGWHTDGDPLFPEAPPAGETTPPYCLHVFVPLVDLTPALGPTEFRPRGGGPVAAPLAAAGEPVLFDYRTVHRATPHTGDYPRPVLYCTWARPWYDERANRDWGIEAYDAFRRFRKERT